MTLFISVLGPVTLPVRHQFLPFGRQETKKCALSSWTSRQVTETETTHWVACNKNDSMPENADVISRRQFARAAAVEFFVGAPVVAGLAHPAFAIMRRKRDRDLVYKTTESGLKYADFDVGGGKTPKPGDRVVVHYTGKFENGITFASSRDSDVPGSEVRPYGFIIGIGRAIKGWDEGVMTMRVGGKRRLIIPPELAYGEKGVPKLHIPPNSTLVFDIELLSVAQEGPRIGKFIEG